MLGWIHRVSWTLFSDTSISTISPSFKLYVSRRLTSVAISRIFSSGSPCLPVSVHRHHCQDCRASVLDANYFGAEATISFWKPATEGKLLRNPRAVDQTLGSRAACAELRWKQRGRTATPARCRAACEPSARLIDSDPFTPCVHDQILPGHVASVPYKRDATLRS